MTEEIALEKKITEKNTLKATGNVLLQKKALNVKIAIGLLAVTAIAAVARHCDGRHVCTCRTTGAGYHLSDYEKL